MVKVTLFIGLLLSLALTNAATDAERKTAATNLINQRFHDDNDQREWIKDKDHQNDDYTRYELKQLYCTGQTSDCWHISIHVHNAEIKQFDKIYAYDYTNNQPFEGAKIRFGHWTDYDLVSSEHIQRPRCRWFCKPFDFSCDGCTVIIKHRGGDFVNDARYLRVDPNDLDEANAHGGIWGNARWKIHRLPDDVIKLQSTKSNKYLRIEKVGNNYIVNVKGGGGGWTTFKIRDHDKTKGTTKLESVQYPGKFVEVTQDLQVVVGDGGVQAQMTLFEEHYFGHTFNFDEDDATVVIKHMSHGARYLRVDPKDLDEANAHGGVGSYARWKVHTLPNDEIKLQSTKSDKYLRMEKQGNNYLVNVKGTGGELTPFKLHRSGEPGTVRLESVKYPGQFIAVQNMEVLAKGPEFNQDETLKFSTRTDTSPPAAQ